MKKSLTILTLLCLGQFYFGRQSNSQETTSVPVDSNAIIVSEEDSLPLAAPQEPSEELIEPTDDETTEQDNVATEPEEPVK